MKTTRYQKTTNKTLQGNIDLEPELGPEVKPSPVLPTWIDPAGAVKPSPQCADRIGPYKMAGQPLPPAKTAVMVTLMLLTTSTHLNTAVNPRR